MKNLFDVTGKTILITGASRGIGKSLALGFRDAGAIVYGTGTKQETIAWMKDTKIEGRVNNLLEEDKIKDIISEIKTKHGKLDVLINNAGDKRIAIRYYYLWLLQKLNKYHHIKFHPEKTNSDYLYELTNVKYRTSFANLSYIYDYTWYGEAELNEEDFARVKDNFDTTISQII